MPEELKARDNASGEASLRGHLKAEGEEETGSQSYIPPDPKDDKALPARARPSCGVQKNRLTRPVRADAELSRRLRGAATRPWSDSSDQGLAF